MGQDTRHSTLRWTGTSDYMTTGAASSQSNVFGTNCREIRVVAFTAGCHINIGQNPTAAATDNNGIFLPVGVVEYFHVTPGQRIAAIREGGSDGTLCIAEMTR